MMSGSTLATPGSPRSDSTWAAVPRNTKPRMAVWKTRVATKPCAAPRSRVVLAALVAFASSTTM